ncbi:transcription factor IBH1-like 1 [Tasmannia lanceolata]|uniref:transcription factor IBH1-like 1 n=1 Tax=Tasmannia lanceolata TaxID=3420 RepID=UPI0040645177
MQDTNLFKQVFLKKLLVGLLQVDLSSKNMSFLERKRAIKLSSDVALAFARNGVNWSRAIIRNVSKQEKNKTLVRNILGEKIDRQTKPCHAYLTCKRAGSNRILRRSYTMRRIRKCAPKRSVASAIAKRMLKRRTQVLKCLIPGGESLDELSLLEETMDYIVCLRAQVDVMRHLANAYQCKPIYNQFPFASI